MLKAINRQKQQALFAIGSYVFSVAAASADPAGDYLQQLDAELSILAGGLPDLYASMQDSEGQQIWTRAFYQDAPEGMWSQGAGTEYFSYLLLKSRGEQGDGQFLVAELPTEPNFVSEIGKQGQIPTILAHFQEDRERWRKLVPDTWLPAIPKLQQVFAQLTAERTKAEKTRSSVHLSMISTCKSFANDLFRNSKRTRSCAVSLINSEHIRTNLKWTHRLIPYRNGV